MKTKFNVCKINDVVRINKQFYKIILINGSNGETKWEKPIIKKLENKEFKKY